MMRKPVIIIFFLVYFYTAFSQSVIPLPSKISVKEKDEIILSASTVVCSDKLLEYSSAFFTNYCNRIYGLNLTSTSIVKRKTGNNVIRLRYDSKYKQDSYRLIIDKKGVFIEGSESGVFYGIQTLIQLLPVSKNANPIKIPCLTISDEPRFAYRGLMLDVSRHFFPVWFVKKVIDYMAYHKLNYFHWHLCDDQGWRIEIKSYPLLTQVGAWRDGTITGRYPGNGNDGKRYGGYYTQDEIRDVVRYAAQRYITVIPEIEMPGHCLAALSAYPYLGCTGANYKVMQTWGVSKDVLCVGNDSVFTFLEKVIDEVTDIFPSKYIHIGGDECPRDRWKQCPKCQARMIHEGLANESALQSYLVNRVEKYIHAKGRQIIAWDETLDEDVNTSAYIMSWRGDGSGGCLKATSTDHYVIMTPSYGFYFDYPQQTEEDSLTANWGGVTSVKKVYNIEPVLPQVNPEKDRFIIGAQANVWTEYMSNPCKVEYMFFPRLSAMSEVVWSPREKRNWEGFKKRMQMQYKRYILWGSSFNTADLDSE
jgi:hexosaminidase